jgi:hypothetical protein
LTLVNAKQFPISSLILRVENRPPSRIAGDLAQNQNLTRSVSGRSGAGNTDSLTDIGRIQSFLTIFPAKCLTDRKIVGITFLEENGGIGSINLKRRIAGARATFRQRGGGMAFVVNQDLMVFL